MDSKFSAPTHLKTSATPTQSKPKDRDFLSHLEAYLAKRDGVDKLLKISRYATKIILASSVLPETLLLTQRLKSFESSVGLSRKAFRLGKFVQDINALRNSPSRRFSSLLLLTEISQDEMCLNTSIDIAISRGIGYQEEETRMKKLREKKLMKRLSTVQYLADGLMALADIRNGKGSLSGPLLVSSAGLLSAIISTHKNWVSC
ncbi:hypothetical protein SLA2020_196700 [Shorea laevis]